MKQLLTLCLACLAVLPAQAARRIGEAEVRAGANGVPCFTISQREEERGGAPDFGSITVTASGDRLPLWRMAMPRDRTFPVAFSMCIPYGGRIPALPQTPAAVLKEGELYTVVIEARPGKSPVGRNGPLRYQTRFCLARQPAGLKVHHVGAERRAGADLYGCLPGRG